MTKARHARRSGCLFGIAAMLLWPALDAGATTGPGCLVVVNVSAGDALNLRRHPSASATIVDTLVPGRHGVLHLDAPCEPPSVAWGRRWCPVTHYGGDRVTRGWVKARFVRDSECP